MLKQKWFGLACAALVSCGLFAACAQEVAEEPAVRLPPREHTWVRTETVKKTKDDYRDAKDEARAAIPVDAQLKQRLTTVDSGRVTGGVKGLDTCLAALAPLDEKRMKVQKAGGLWHAFERAAEVRPNSGTGMQLDSNLNKMVFAIRHLCRTAKGLPLDNVARFVSEKVTEVGREAAKEELVKLGNHPADVDIWLEHAEYSRNNHKRDLDFQSIERLIAQAEPLIKFYGELYERNVDETTSEQFLSDAVTLLDAVNGHLAHEHYLVLAVKEDKEIPFENLSTDL